MNRSTRSSMRVNPLVRFWTVRILQVMVILSLVMSNMGLPLGIAQAGKPEDRNHVPAFDVNAQDWEAARLPNLAGFQASQFTGAATYSFPIQVPAGAGGLQPSLALSYNSQVVDSASGKTQASWVGMGWSLDTDYIQRSMNGTMTDLTDDIFSVSANGASGEILKDASGSYHTTNESFWRIQYNAGTGPGTDYWIAWDKTGTQYFFGYDDGDRAHYPNLNPENCPGGHDGDPVTWRWSLSKIRHIYGLELIYNYSTTTKSIKSDPCGADVDYSVDVVVYPAEIIYPNKHYRVLLQKADDRLDYDTDWDGIHSYIFYQRSRLTNLVIQHDADGDGNFGNAETVRRYDLIYAQGTDSTIFPNYVWPGGGKTLTLKEIKEYGRGGVGPLPSTTFTYGDNLHLTRGGNGYGGSVSFSYEAWHEIAADASSGVDQHFGAPGNPCRIGDDEGGWGPYANARCTGAQGDLEVHGTGSKGIPPEWFHRRSRSPDEHSARRGHHNPDLRQRRAQTEHE